MSRDLRIETDGFEPIAVGNLVDESVNKEVDRVTRSIGESRARAAEFLAQSEIVEQVYMGEFLSDVRTANTLALAIASGDTSVSFDAQSLGEHGDNPDTVREYLSPFVVQDPSREYPFAQLTFPATAVIPYKGQEHHIQTYSGWNPLTPYNFSPSFNANVSIPTLVDPQLRTFAELKELEAIDPGHAEQLFGAYRMAARGQKEQNPAAIFRDPLVVRMVAIPPTGYDYMTDFVPRVTMGRDSAWDPYLLVNGALNPSGDYLNSQATFARNTVVLNSDGKETALRVSRPLPGQTAEEQGQALVPLANHELNRMAVILFPYKVEAKPRASFEVPFASSHYSFDGGGATRSMRGTVGGAALGAGATGWASASKRQVGFLGDTYVPQTGGQPVIYSIRLLTAQRDPDTVAG